MKTVVTGASGLVGGNLALELIQRGHSVRATQRAGSQVSLPADQPIEWVEAEVTDETALRDAFYATFQFSSEKAERELGYTHGPLEPAIADAIAFFRTQGVLA